MILIPSLQLLGGKVVRLENGNRDEVTVLGENPLAMARAFAQQGALFFQLVDLDAVFGTGDNLAVLDRFVDAALPTQFGGGVRTAERAEEILTRGADRVLIGTLFHNDPAAAKAIVDRFGVRILGALDVEDGEVRTNGWADAGSGLDQAWQGMRDAGVQAVVYREVRRGDRAGAQPDHDTLRELCRRSVEDGLSLYADILARTEADIEAVQDIEGLDGAILGERLYAGDLDLQRVLVHA